MAMMFVHRGPGLTRESYERVAQQLAGKPRLESKADWPVPGLLAHAAGEGPDGFVVVDVWESEEAFARFGEIAGPLMQAAGIQPPQLFAAHTAVV